MLTEVDETIFKNMIPEPKKQMSMGDIIKQEYKKCAESPVHFMKHYVKIQHPTKGGILFNLYPFQEEMLSDISNYKYNIILKSRQMGISTLLASYALWVSVFNKDKNIVVVSLKQDVAKEIITKVRYANDHLPTWLKIVCEEDNKLSLKFKNGSQIRATSTTSNSGVSLAISELIIDECAMIPDMADMWAAIQPALSIGGKCHILSTPRNIGEWYHKTWVDANEGIKDGVGKNGFHPIILPWDLHPDRNQAWRDSEGAKLGSPKEAAREYDCSFASSGDSVIDLATIEFYKKTFKEEPVECRGVDRALWIWQYPDYNKTYIIAADTSVGDGGDYQACHIIDAVTLEQCAEYKGQITTKEFGNLLAALATEYNNALLVVERENTGYAVIQAIIDKEYPNLFYMTADLKYVDVESQHNNNYNREEQKAKAGFSTNTKTRPLIISYLEQCIREKTVIIRSSRTLSELETFIWKNGKAQAMQGFNDDLTMSLGISLWIRATALKLRQQGIDLTKASLDHINRTKLDTIPVYKSQARNVAQQSWQMSTGRSANSPLGNANTEDLSWLL